MRTAAVTFVLSMICAAILTPVVRKLAHRFGALDHALAARKIHGRAIPRLGGIAIVVGFYAPLLALFCFQSDVGALFLAEKNLALGIFVGGLLIAVLGVYDDLRGADARKKFVVQFAVAGVMYYLGFRVEVLANPFGDAIQLGWVSLPITLFWIVGIINAMNLIDGLDGLAGGVALVAVSTIFLISVHHVQPLMILFCAALAGAVVGFLFYNFNPASIFMGDTGSMFLGFVLATSSIKTGHKSSTAFAVVLIILGFPILDTLLAMSRRALRGRPIFHADREHIHHRLLALGLSQRQAVLLLYAVCLIFSGVALAITYTGNPALSITLVTILAVTLLVCLRRLGYIKLDLNHYLSDQRRRNRYLNAAVRPFSLSLRDAATPDEIWAVVRGVSAVFEAECASLQLPIADASFSSGFLDDKTDGVFRVRFSLARVRKDPRCVEFGWRDGRATLDRDIEIAIELFCNHVGDAAERIMSKSLVRAGKSVALPSE